MSLISIRYFSSLSPNNTHWMAVKKILCYLKVTYNHGLVYKPSGAQLTAYSDVDYAENRNTRHSTRGFCAFIWVLIWCLGVQRGRRLFLSQMQKLNIGNLPIQLMNYSG